MPLSFRLLGPLEVWQDGHEISLGPGRQQALLALLLLHRNEVVSADRLIDDLWAGAPPASAHKVLQGYVSQLRRALPPDTIATRGSGYLLVAGETDADEFIRLVDNASALAPAAAAPVLRRALALWRGPPLGEFEYEDWAGAEIARLQEQRLVALEERIDLDLELGGHRQVVAELEALVAEHPLRERLRGDLMLALYRSGRQADALETYAQGRRKLDELGIEPSPALVELQRAVLTQDESLAPPPRRVSVSSALAARGRLIVSLGAAILAAAIASAVWEGTRSTGGPAGPASGNAIVDIDPASGDITARIAVGKTPTSIVAGPSSVWAASADEVTRIDPVRRRIAATFSTEKAPMDLAFGASGLWLVNAEATTTSGLGGFVYPDSVSRLDPSSFVATRTVSLPRTSTSASFGAAPGASIVALADGGVWTIGPDAGDVSRIDATTKRVVANITGLNAQAIAASADAVWVDDGNSTLTRIGIGNDRVAQRIELGSSSLGGIGIGAGAVWVTDPVDGTVWRVEPGPPVVTRTVSVGIGVDAVSVGGGAVWATNPFLGTVSRIDPATNTVARTIDVAGTPEGLSAEAGGVWVSVTGAPGPGTKESGVEALPAASCGPVLTGNGKATVLIASDLPLRAGRAITQAASAIQFVLQQHHFQAGRYRIGYQSCDDSTAQVGDFDFATCGANAKAYARDRDVLGVIGPVDTSCALAEIPIMNDITGSPLALLGLLTTDPELTRPRSFGPPGETALLYPTGRRSFSRIVAPDQVQGAAQATLAHQLGLVHVYVLTDDTRYASDLTTGFDNAARSVGLTVAGTSAWNPNAQTYAQLAARVARSDAGGVLVAGYGGPGAGRLIRALRARVGARFPIIAGDGFTAIPYLLKTTGQAADGMYITFPGRPDERLPATGKAFTSAFAATQADTRVESYGAAYGAQATEILLAAIARSDGTRASVIRELFATKVSRGILGDFSFTKDGDMTPTPVTVFRVAGGTRPSSTYLPDFNGAVVDRVVDIPIAIAG